MKAYMLPKFVSDGSGRPTAFNDGGWGGPSRSYVTSATNLKKKSIDEIIKGAKSFSKTARQNSTKVSAGAGNPMIINDHRANLVDESASEEEDDDDNCKFSYLEIITI